VLVGQVSWTFTGSPTPLTIPVGFRAVFPTGSGLTYYGMIVAAGPSGNPAFMTIRSWANGAITVVAMNGSAPSYDFSSARWPSKGV
jgi:hypothetical protein